MQKIKMRVESFIQEKKRMPKPQEIADRNKVEEV